MKMPLTRAEKNIKRGFDVFFACIGLFVLGWFILLMAIISNIYINVNGFFR
jgi:lipopolysaccharide/colanic/teichoic acid biosynthesis glycosyltransferase